MAPQGSAVPNANTVAGVIRYALPRRRTRRRRAALGGQHIATRSHAIGGVPYPSRLCSFVGSMPALTGPVWRIHRRQPVQPTTRSSSGGGKKFGHIPHFIEVPRYVPHTAGIIEMVDEPSHLVRELFRRHRRGRTTRGVLDGPDDPLAADQDTPLARASARSWTP